MNFPQFPSPLIESAARLGDLLQERSLQVVFAESCTAGLVTSAIARIPGISAHLCGSAVVYQEATKTAWLGVPQEWFDDPQIGAVSGETAQAMVLGVLEKTPQADWAASVTGHLGPEAPAELDGVAYVGIACRKRGSRAATLVSVQRVSLDAEFLQSARDQLERRLERQVLAAIYVLQGLTQAILAVVP